jgi:membrane peptidoglycan carboxypeptidase
MTAMGMHNDSGETFSPFPPAIVLGADYASPLTVASSYATFASGGIYCEPLPVTKIVDTNGKEIPLETPECERVVDEEVALGAVELLQGVVSPSGSGWKAVLDGNRPAGGKTGTNDNSTHTWFAGFTPQLSTAVFVGVPTGAQAGADREDLRIGDIVVEGPLYGSSIAAPLWKRIMDMALADVPVEDWEQPSDEILNGKRITIPSVIGMTEDKAKETLEDAGLTASVQPVGSSQPQGTVVYTTPGTGTSIRTSTPVVLHVSTGQAPVVQAPVAPQPQPAQPAPAQPAPVEPEPSEPAPSEPEPSEPEPAPAPAPEPPPADEPGPPGGPPGQDDD